MQNWPMWYFRFLLHASLTVENELKKVFYLTQRRRRCSFSGRWGKTIISKILSPTQKGLSKESVGNFPGLPFFQENKNGRFNFVPRRVCPEKVDERFFWPLSFGLRRDRRFRSRESRKRPKILAFERRRQKGNPARNHRKAPRMRCK